MIVPDSAPAAKLELVQCARRGGTAGAVRALVGQVMEEGGHHGLVGTFLHPCASRPMIAGNGTIGWNSSRISQRSTP